MHFPTLALPRSGSKGVISAPNNWDTPHNLLEYNTIIFEFQYIFLKGEIGIY